ncbi:MAG: alpha/beta fold hydrolase, partial [Bacilli bacterium]
MIKHVEIKNNNNNILRGYLDLPDNSTKLVVMFHGYTGNKTEHNGFFRTLSRKLSQMNIASLRMDYSCNGESDGEFYDFDFDVALDDAKLMIDYAYSLSNIKDIVVCGFSMGGAIASLVCNYRDLKGLLLWSPAGDLGKNLRKRFDNAPKMENNNVYMPGFELSENLVNTMGKYDFYLEAPKFKNPVYIIHGMSDKAVDYLRGIEYAVKFPNANIHLIDKAGHGYDDFNSA